MDIVTPQVAAALDIANITDRKTAHIFSAMASTGLLKQDVSMSPDNDFVFFDDAVTIE